jgi:phosphoglycerate dehydrogenase-like enzyme
MSLNVYFPSLPMPNTLDELRRLVPAEVHLFAAPADEQPLDTDVIVVGSVTEEQLARSPHLRAVIVPFAGIPFPTQTLLRGYPVVTLHNLHFNDISTAEMAFALLLAASKHIAELDHRIRQGNWTWNDDTHPTDTFPGKTAVILGYGAIGKRLAPMCQALGMQVIGVRRHAPDVPERDGVALFSVAHLAELLPRADVLVSLLPHTRETEGLLGAKELALLPPNCILVNVGRGPVIDEEALYSVLAERRIRSAGIDVWYQYPTDDEERSHTYPSRFPYHELDNIVMTPHRAGWLQSFEKLRVAALAELLNAANAGEPIPNLVDKELGY